MQQLENKNCLYVNCIVNLCVNLLKVY